jgi:hypothetical protein
MSFVPNLASAQAYRGKFTLPFSARWGGLLLPAGDYSFKVDSLSGLGLVSVLHDGKILGSVMIGSVSYFAPPDKSNLVAIPTGDAYRVTALHVQDECVIEFQIPKNERQMITREPELSRLVTIPVGKA